MVAAFDYTPSEQSPNENSELELSFKAGDVITIYGNMVSQKHPTHVVHSDIYDAVFQEFSMRFVCGFCYYTPVQEANILFMQW